MKLAVDFAGRHFSFYAGRRPDVMTCGMMNETADGYFVPFIDYDHIEYCKVLKDLQHLNRVFGLCTFLVAASKEEEFPLVHGGTRTVGNYMVFGFDKMTYHGHREMLRHTRCDWWFAEVPERRFSQKCWVLRVLPKEAVLGDGTWGEIRPGPVFKQAVRFPGPCPPGGGFARGRACSFEHSDAHWLACRKLWPGLKGSKPAGAWDGLKEVEFFNYGTKDKAQRQAGLPMHGQGGVQV